MSKFLGKFIGSNRNIPTTQSAPGIWNTVDALQSRKSDSWPATTFKNIVLPEITGTSTIGYKALGCTTGIWSIMRNMLYTYQWLRDGVDIIGATTSVYTLIPSDGNTIISCRVVATYTLANYTLTVTSLGTAAIVIPVVNQAEYTIPGTYTWVCPPDVYSVSVVCVGAGSQGQYVNSISSPTIGYWGGGGGGTGWKNNITVIPGTSYTVFVGLAATYSPPMNANYSEDSYFISNLTVLGGKGTSGSMGGTGGTYLGDGGGMGGAGALGASSSSGGGGGGTGGYTGAGGAGGATNGFPGVGGGGGGGGGSYYDTDIWNTGTGGGVGIYGIGTNGTGGIFHGTYPDNRNGSSGSLLLGNTVAYGNGGAMSFYRSTLGVPSWVSTARAGSGAVRIIWPGNLRQFPGTRTTNERDILVTTLNLPDVVVTQGTTVSVTPVVASRGVSPYTYTISPALPTGLSFNTSTGAITGTTIVLQTLTAYTVTVVDSITLGFTTQTSYKIFNLTCNTAIEGTYPTLVATTIIPNISVKQEVVINSTPIIVTGGLLPYTYSIDRILPLGISLNSATGVVSGSTDAIVINSSYIITAVDKSLRSINSSFILTISPVDRILGISNIGTPPILTHNIGTYLDIVPVVGSAGISPYTYLIYPSLPSGLSFNNTTGRITGNASEELASTSYYIVITDKLLESSLTFINIVIVKPALIATTSIANIVATTSISISTTPVYASSSAGGPYTFSITPSLPSGLLLNTADGIISGITTIATGLITYTIGIKDKFNRTSYSSFTMQVKYPALSTTSNITAINSFKGDTMNSIPVTGLGGISPYTYSISPTIPTDLSFNTNTGALTGVPMSSFVITTMTVTVTDSVGQTSPNYFTLYIDPAAIASQVAFTIPGTYAWTVPEGVTSISLVMITPGGSPQTAIIGSTAYAGSGGGGLGYINNLTVTPGTIINIALPYPKPSPYGTNTRAENTTITWNTNSITGISGSSGTGATTGGAGGYVTFSAGLFGVSNTGGTGGVHIGTTSTYSLAGGGGAAGYSGTGGTGGTSSSAVGGGATAGLVGTGGGGGGGGGSSGTTYGSGGGGGTGIFGQGSNGTAGALISNSYSGNGGGGSGGGGGNYYGGGVYGGGAGGTGNTNITNASDVVYYGTTGGNPAVRIIWPGATRIFPSSGTANTAYTAPYIWSTSTINPIIAVANSKKVGYVLLVPANSISDISAATFNRNTGSGYVSWDTAPNYIAVPNGIIFNGITYSGYIKSQYALGSTDTYTYSVTWKGSVYYANTVSEAISRSLFIGLRPYVN